VEKTLIYLPVLAYFTIFPRTEVITAALIFTIYPAFLPPTRKIRHRNLFQFTKKSRIFTLILFLLIILLPVFYEQSPGLPEILISIFAIAIPEEYFFRYIYFQLPAKTPFHNDTNPQKLHRLANELLPCLNNGLIFMLFHLAVRPGILSALTFFPGMLLALVYRKTGDFMLCCALHVFMNLLFFTFLQKKLIFLLPA
jgi:membrane protease YdiL (CAAX protease family)